MNALDISIIGVLLLNAATGFKKGMIKIVFELLALFGGCSVGLKYFPLLTPFLEQHLPLNAPYSSILCFIIIWSVILVFISIIGSIIHRMIRYSGLGLFNRMGGLIAGTLRGVFYSLPIVLPLLFFNHTSIDSSTIVSPIKDELRIILDEGLKFVPTFNETTS